jgi:hypothetical protein
MTTEEQAVSILVRLGYNQTHDPQNYEEIKWAVSRCLELAEAGQYESAKQKAQPLDTILRDEVLAAIARLETGDAGDSLKPLSNDPGVTL